VIFVKLLSKNVSFQLFAPGDTVMFALVDSRVTRNFFARAASYAMETLGRHIGSLAGQDNRVVKSDTFTPAAEIVKDGDKWMVSMYIREFALPADIDADHVEASYRNGVLELTLPVRESAKPRRIAIGSSGSKQLTA
jgi:HSP20 family molecular chaperone IbpA